MTLLVGSHLLQDIQLGVRKNTVFGGNVLDAVVHLLEIAAAGQIARGAICFFSAPTGRHAVPPGGPKATKSRQDAIGRTFSSSTNLHSRPSVSSSVTPGCRS